MTEIALHLPEPPSANAHWRKVGNRILLSKAGRRYKLTVQSKFLREFGTMRPLIGVVAVQMVWTRGKRVGDLDNRIKPLLDALKGLAFVDDKQVIEIHAYRRDAKGQPGVHVTVSATGVVAPVE